MRAWRNAIAALLFTALPALCLAQPVAASDTVKDVTPAPVLANAPAAADPAAVPASVPASASAPAPVARAGIALILPLRMPALARAAEATRAGFMAAREAGQDKPAVRLIETDGTAAQLLAAYRDAAAGALAVVGPLTRVEVAALMAEAMPVPTLVLNLPEMAADAPLMVPRLPAGMRALTLNIEFEAQGAAQAGWRNEARNAVVVSGGSALHKRAAAAFTETWVKQGGRVGNTVEYAGNLARVRQEVERAKADVVFLAVDAQTARLLRPHLGRNASLIAIAQVFTGAPKDDAQKEHDLNGVRFMDMPWLHRAAEPNAVARPVAPLSAELERLYALGVDAWRVALMLSQGHAAFELEGATGRLKVQDGLIARTLTEVEFRDGDAVIVR